MSTQKQHDETPHRAFRAGLALAVLLVAVSSDSSAASSPPDASSVCVEFMENHTGDPNWKDACITALESVSAEAGGFASMATSGEAMSRIGLGRGRRIRVHGNFG
jgi:hypothetical protein